MKPLRCALCGHSITEQHAPDCTTMDALWADLTHTARQRICKQYGFGDWKAYAGYRWQDFQPHTREALTELVLQETDASGAYRQ